MFAEVAALAIAAALASTVSRPTGAGGTGGDQPTPAERIVPALLERRLVLAAWVQRGTGCLCWFSFTLGLVTLGEETGAGPALLAAALSAYGAASVLAALAAVPLVRRLPVLVTTTAAWFITGVTWVTIAASPTMPVIVVSAAVSGTVVVVANTAGTAMITRGSSGGQRRALLAGQNVVVSAASSAGLLVGGPVLALAGGVPTLIVTGSLTALTAVTTFAIRLLGRARRQSVARH